MLLASGILMLVAGLAFMVGYVAELYDNKILSNIMIYISTLVSLLEIILAVIIFVMEIAKWAMKN